MLFNLKLQMRDFPRLHIILIPQSEIFILQTFHPVLGLSDFNFLLFPTFLRRNSVFQFTDLAFHLFLS